MAISRGSVVLATANVKKASFVSDAKSAGKAFFQRISELFRQLTDDKPGVRLPNGEFIPDENSPLAQFRINQAIIDERNKTEGFIRLVGIVRDLNQRAFRLGG